MKSLVGLKIWRGVMKMDFNCPKCRCRNYEVKNVILPEKKNKLMKVELNLYYAKTCLECGYTEFYLAKIVDEDEKKEKINGNIKVEGNI